MREREREREQARERQHLQEEVHKLKEQLREKRENAEHTLREEFEALKLTIDGRVTYPKPPQLEGGERKTEEQQPSSRISVPNDSVQQQSSEPQVSPVGTEKRST